MKPRKPPTPKTLKPWDIRSASKGSDTSNELYMAVGRALSAWEGVENALADAFTLLIGAREIVPPVVPAVRAYGAVAGFSGRADMLQAAAEGFFEWIPRGAPHEDHKLTEYRKKLSDEFGDLLDEARGFALRRNEIAHGIVTGGSPPHYLYPPLYSARKYRVRNPDLTMHERASFCYSAIEVHYYEAQFHALENKLHDFNYRLRSVRRS